MKRLMIGLLAMAMVLAVPAMADEAEPLPQGNGNSGGWGQFKQDVKEAGRNIGQTGKEIGLGVAKGAKEGSKAVKDYFAPDTGGQNKGDSAK